MAAWIPADVLLVVMGTPGEDLRAVDKATAALGWTTVDDLLPGGARLRMVLEAEVNALCRDVVAADALPAGTVRTSAGALLITVGNEIIVMRDRVACTVHGGAASRREHQAMRLAALVDDERLLRRTDARAALARLPVGPLVAWGGGDLVSGISLDRIDPETGLAMTGLGNLAVTVGVDADRQQLWLAMVSTAPALPNHEPTMKVAVGPRVQPPMPSGLPSLPVPMADENVDVPESPEYKQAIGRLGAVLTEAITYSKQIAEIEERALEAWMNTWGEAEIDQTVRDGLLMVHVTWQPPAWPVEATRVKASSAYHQLVRAEAAELTASYQGKLAEARVLVDELIKIRARDVAAWDKTHR